MRNIKLALWIFCLYILQNVFYPTLSLSGITPDLLFAFSVAYAVTEPKFKNISRVIIICAVLAGLGTGRVFPISVAMVGIGAVAAYIAVGYLRFIPKIIKSAVILGASEWLMCCFEYFAVSGALSVGFVTGEALMYAAYTVAAFVVIYLILQKTMNIEKILLVEERN